MGRSRASLARDIYIYNRCQLADVTGCGEKVIGVDENDQTDPASGNFLQSVLFFSVIFKD